VEWHVRLRADITCDHTVGTVDVVVGEVTAEGDGSVLGSAASPLGVRWKFRPFARLPKRVHSVGRNQWLKLSRELRSVVYVVLKFNGVQKKLKKND
jgi:hypothetical protein